MEDYENSYHECEDNDNALVLVSRCGMIKRGESQTATDVSTSQSIDFELTDARSVCMLHMYVAVNIVLCS